MSEDITEYFDTPEDLDRKVRTLANLIRQSKHPVIYTGAGVSTSIGIPDFRGPKGVWTMRSKGLRTPRLPNYMVYPSKTHMAIKELIDKGLIKHLVSQNTDGLHVKSGVSRTNLSELHGNTNIEICKHCGREYYRDYRVRNNPEVHEHGTGRYCTNCNHELEDTIINFGENLPIDQLSKATSEAKKSDLAIVFGSSLKVSPACNLPLYTVKRGGKFVICNLQKTPMDQYANLLIHARSDEIMEKLMSYLDLTIPSWIFRKTVELSCKDYQQQKKKVKVSMPDQSQSFGSSFKNIYVVYKDNNNKEMERKVVFPIGDSANRIISSQEFIVDFNRVKSLDFLFELALREREDITYSDTVTIHYDPINNNNSSLVATIEVNIDTYDVQVNQQENPQIPL
ncbi:hypothetical protein ABK040_001701 [Willaertia magna]